VAGTLNILYAALYNFSDNYVIRLSNMRSIMWTDIFMRVSGGEMPPFRPPIPPKDRTNHVHQLIQLMRNCWEEHPTLRPDFSNIRSRFLRINKGKYDSFQLAELFISYKLVRMLSVCVSVSGCWFAGEAGNFHQNI